MDLREQLQQTLGGAYTIDYELKGGGMAHVFVAEENALGRKVVVKVLNTEIGETLSAERFAREVRLVASLQHPNIVPLLQAGKARDLVYYTMPFIKGDSLRARLRQTGRLEVGQAISILRDVASALEYAHGEGIVHRDIKPENILLAGTAAVVTDFGIAKALSASRRIDVASPITDAGSSLTELGMVPGTPAYAAPEQIAGESVDYRADIYSWGLVAYELLAGAHPFEGKTSQQLFAAHIGERPAPLDQRVKGLPEVLTEVVMRSLEKHPAKRPQTACELVDAMSRGPAGRGKTSLVGSSRSAARYGAAVAIVLVLIGAYLGRGRIMASSTADQARSLAVLPFSNVGGDTANAYFADGIANELTSELTKVPGLRVASRTSAFAMRSRGDLDVRDIGKRLGVGTVLEGTVQRSSGKLRVSAQLTNAADGLTLWSDTYERENREIFAVQDDIARAIIVALRPRLTASGGQTVNPGTEGPGTTNLEAYDLYLRGLYLVERRGPGVAQAANYFTQAIAKDTSFAKAYAALSTALALSQYFTPTPAYSVEGKTIAAANHALAIDPRLAEPHAALALSHMHALRWD
ncbi:MAG TPA: serine/threonine-protein kinase, partial [Gemmatimonadaceae bacterium]|nr:serine/threonine-protein kinase [Gemmatimonadaceae bacterium]